MKPFLYLDNWRRPQPETRFDRLLSETGLDVERLRTNDGEFPAGTDYCGVYVSPSFDGAYDDEAWIHREHEVLSALAQDQVPMLGLCFGSQIMASALCGRDQVEIRAEREMGYGGISLTDAARAGDPLVGGLPDAFSVFHWHQDEVRPDDPDIIVLAESPDCANQIWRWRHGPAWGVQPHPEFDHKQLIAWFTHNRELFETAGLTLQDLTDRADDNLDAGRLIANFLTFVVARANRDRPGPTDHRPTRPHVDTGTRNST